MLGPSPAATAAVGRRDSRVSVGSEVVGRIETAGTGKK